MANKPSIKLNEKKKTFCKEYIIDLDGAKAARRAGYAPKASRQKAYELFGEPLVKKYIGKLMEKRSEKTQITAEYVLTKIRNTLENAEHDKDYRSLLKAAELLGKNLKLFTDVQENNHVFTQMGRVTIGGEDGENRPIAVTFDVGQEPRHAGID